MKKVISRFLGCRLIKEVDTYCGNPDTYYWINNYEQIIEFNNEKKKHFKTRKSANIAFIKFSYKVYKMQKLVKG